MYRYERSGTLSGLFRVRGFTQDDAHVFCLPDQVSDEIFNILNLTEDILSKFGFKDYEIFLSTRPEKSIGDDKVWPKSMEAQLHSKNAGDFWNIESYTATVDAKRTDGRHTVKMHETNEKPLGEWNEYRIRAEGPRIQLWLNGVQTVDYTEAEAGVEAKGLIAVQIHGNATSVVQYKDLKIEEL